MSIMTPRERVLAALRRETPDRVPWAEAGIDEGLQVRLMGTADFEPAEMCRRLGLDAFGGSFLKSPITWQDAENTGNFATYYYPDQITFDFVPPWIAEIGVAEESGRKFVKKGLLTSRADLDLFDKFLPDPDHPARYEIIDKWIRQYRQDYAVFARIRLGAASTLESMGLDVFSLMVYDDPEFVHEVHRRFSEWCAKVIRNLNQMDFDFFWAADDVAGNSGPFMSPKLFREFILPHMQVAAAAIKKPWIYHSDGNLFPVLPDLLTLGMDAIHPIQPSAMDIGRVKREYGHRVAIVGNIDLDYTLTRGEPAEVEAEVKERIRTAAPGGGYIISSANSLADYCKVENVWAMARAIQRYGKYPIQLD